MFLLSRKGSILVLLGTGLLLGLLGPSEAIKCFTCPTPDGDYDDLNQCQTVSDCEQNSCMNGRYTKNGKVFIHHTCGDPKPGRTEKSPLECVKFVKGKELHCYCFSDQCNSQVFSLDENPAGEITAGTGGGHHHGGMDKKPKDSGVSGTTSTPSLWLAQGAVIAAYLARQHGPGN